MVAQWENECISLSVLPAAQVMVAHWETECVSLYVLPVLQIQFLAMAEHSKGFFTGWSDRFGENMGAAMSSQAHCKDMRNGNKTASSALRSPLVINMAMGLNILENLGLPDILALSKQFLRLWFIVAGSWMTFHWSGILTFPSQWGEALLLNCSWYSMPTCDRGEQPSIQLHNFTLTVMMSLKKRKIIMLTLRVPPLYRPNQHMHWTVLVCEIFEIKTSCPVYIYIQIGRWNFDNVMPCDYHLWWLWGGGRRC